MGCASSTPQGGAEAQGEKKGSLGARDAPGSHLPQPQATVVPNPLRPVGDSRNFSDLTMSNAPADNANNNASQSTEDEAPPLNSETLHTHARALVRSRREEIERAAAAAADPLGAPVAIDLSIYTWAERIELWVDAAIDGRPFACPIPSPTPSDGDEDVGSPTYLSPMLAATTTPAALAPSGDADGSLRSVTHGTLHEPLALAAFDME
eukprot:CAMPEP_0174835870 /NCGR_PEP_ID=MMETSP1114-20130205/5661_1 /TAXON_ID=312471 /ORGANISM="Neobodo designis, Strain CCAP 1951/1" /LENGTH=207 /DNA_ID=CAMNT_0016069827 /DNA_START=48 /DNA_END=671 /DNA_ORIENTATION=-